MRGPSGWWRTWIARGHSVSVGLFAGVTIGWSAGSPAAVVMLPLGAAVAWHWTNLSMGRAERVRAGAWTVAMVEALIQQLKGGRSLAQSVRAAVGPRQRGAAPFGQASHATVDLGTQPALDRLRAALDAGTGLEIALGRAVGWLPGRPVRGTADAGLHLTLTTLLVLVQRGGPALPALERLDDTLRSAQWVEQEAGVQAAQATASALALAGLPALFAAALALLDRDLARFYLTEPLGAACLATSGLLSYLSWWWMHRIIWRAS